MRASIRKPIVCITAVIAVAGVTASHVTAAKPVRTPISPTPLTLPAGLGCAFDVELRPNEGYRLTTTEFSNGRFVSTTSGSSTVTNLDANRSVSVRERGTVEYVYDETKNDYTVTADGQALFYLFPGDMGPFGPVGANGGLYHAAGQVRETWDLDTDVITSFSLSGRVTDVCALVSS